MSNRELSRTLLRTPAQPHRTHGVVDVAIGVAGLVLSPLYLAGAHLVGTPGLAFRRRCTGLALRQAFARADRVAPKELFQLLAYPMDSVRYFEFDFAWRSVAGLPIHSYLDVSSPRLLPLLLVEDRPDLQATVLNPDRRDLPVTIRFARAMHLEHRCRFENAVIADVDLPAESMDAVTSVSVLEHVPDDRTAVHRMWSLVKPGGRLILTVPCARTASEEYIDQDQYGLLQPGDDGFVFWQRYYDRSMLQERIFSITGTPARSRVYGEKRPGLYSRNVAHKMRDARRYPFWREPYMMGIEYRFFDSIEDLPGMGVIGLEFAKT